ncbi:MAG TPA: beta-propeller fold lactonase family protein [Blastocatellia bacterium]|nr:beta-propeller fold lactonase family protein [Blastocatellia bacterium]
MRITKVTLIALMLTAIIIPFTGSTQTGVPVNTYVNFEGSQTNPVRVSADGARLFAVNTPDARLSVFDLSQESSPALIAEIPVGIEPVSVNPRTGDEAWVVNQVSDSISVVSVSQGIVVDTIYVKDEPADVVFAGNRAFVTASRSNAVRVYDATTRQLLKSIPLAGENPRALAVSPDGSKVYAAFALSGNRTTIVPAESAPPQPAPTNPSLPPAPREGLIVDATDPRWSPGVINYSMPDNDVVEVDVASMTVARYFSGVGTVNLGIAVRPTTGDLYVGNTDARNLVQFETNVRGHFVDNRVTRILMPGGDLSSFDLNPFVDYTVLPNLQAKSTALAQPAAMTFEPTGNSLYVAAFGTDRVARLDANGNVIARIEIGPATGSAVNPRTKRGPRGLALSRTGQFLYVLNRISNTVSVVDTSSSSVVKEMGAGQFDPTPQVIKTGRGFLYDAKLSGNGSASCASCHIDSDMDLLAWDLGNPGGSMQTASTPFGTVQIHPMKGPMTTQTLRGLSGLDPLHWRGDRATFLDFNGAFDSLMGGSTLTSADMTAYRDFVNTIQFQPNPNQNLDRTLPASIAGGNPAAGRNTFLNEPFTSNITCNSCHTANPGPGSNRTIIPDSVLQESQSFKVPQLRNVYQKLSFNNAAGGSTVGGFGILHDGSVPNLFAFLSNPVFQSFSNDTVRKTNLAAFLLCFDTGTAPAVGYARTVTSANVNNTAVVNDWTLLEGQAAAGNIDLIVKGTVNGQRMGLLYRPASNDYQTDRTGVGPFTRTQLRNSVALGNVLTPMGVPRGSGTRMGIDRNLDGVLDGDLAPPPPPPPAAVVTHVASLTTTDVNGNPKSTFRRGETVFWRALIVDQNNAAVSGASVRTDVTGGLSASRTSSTGSNGLALFQLATSNNSSKGSSTIRVISVTKTNTTYDPAANVRTSVSFNLR